MKRRIRYLTTVILVAGLLAGFLTAYGPSKYMALNVKEERIISVIAYAEGHLGEDAAFESLKVYMPSSECVQQIINYGMLPNHVEELKALGYTDVDYSPVTGGSSNTSTDSTDSTPVQQETPAPAPEPEAFTVEDMEETTMWTISEVNYRDGASTDYAKLGSLAKYDEVTVNGVASTGWYRFKLDGDQVAYVSNNYLTTEDPHDRELNIYNNETGNVDTYEFEDQDPEAIDAAIEEIKEDYEEKEPEVEEEPEPEPVVEEPAPAVEEPEPAAEAEPVKEPRSIYWWLVVIGGTGALLVACVAAFFLIYNKVRAKRD